MVGHAFSMGMATAFFQTAAFALFLARFGGELLPFVYIAGAVLNTATGVVYTKIGSRVGFGRLMSGTLVLLLAVVVGLRVGLAVGQFAWLVFFLLIWDRVLSILTDLEYWAVAARLYDVRQSKRLFSLIGSGEVVARIAGNFALAGLTPLIGVSNLLVVSAVGIALCLFFLVIVQRLYSQRLADLPEEPGKKADKDQQEGGFAQLRKVLKDRYLTLIIAVAVLGVFGKYFVEFAYLMQVETRMTNAEHLAVFFGYFNAATQIINLVVRIFLSSRILSRFGVRVGLLVVPAVHTLCTILIIVAQPTYGVAAVFWLVIANQGVYKTLKHPIDYPSFKILYQPLRKDRRLATQIAVETVVTPITLGLSGIIMYLFSNVIPFSPVVFGYVQLVTFGGWTVAAVFAYREYSSALVSALSKRFFDHASFSFNDEKSISLIESKLDSAYSGDIVFALDLLEKVEHPSLNGHLVRLLDHTDANVRLYVLLRIEALQVGEALEAVRRTVDSEADPKVRGAALRALCGVGGDEVVAEVEQYLAGVAPQVCKGALIGLLQRPTVQPGSQPHRKLAELAASSDPAARLLAAQVLTEVASEELEDSLIRLVDDPEPKVCEEAFRAASRVHSQALQSAITAKLSSRRHRRVAAATLVASGESALPALDELFQGGGSPDAKARIAEIVGRIGGSQAISALVSWMDYPNETVRREVFRALRRCGYQTTESDAAEVVDRVRAEVEDATWKLAAVVDLGADPDLELLRSALLGEVNQNRERILLLLSLVYDRESIERAHEHFASESREKRAYALEIIDVTLPAELKTVVLPLYDELDPVQALQRLGTHFPQEHTSPARALRNVFARPERWMNAWARTCAFYCARRSGKPELERALHDQDGLPPVKESDGWSFPILGEEAAQQAETDTMLTVERVIVLKTVSLFSKIPEEILAEVASALEEEEYAAQEVVFDKGDQGNCLYIIASGRVRVYDGDKTINMLGEREIFGELAALDPEPRSAAIAAEEPTVLFRLDRDSLYELMADRIDVAQAIMGVVCQRLRRMTRIAMGWE
jgi:HEAT repeat protein